MSHYSHFVCEECGGRIDEDDGFCRVCMTSDRTREPEEPVAWDTVVVDPETLPLFPSRVVAPPSEPSNPSKT